MTHDHLFFSQGFFESSKVFLIGVLVLALCFLFEVAGIYVVGKLSLRPTSSRLTDDDIADIHKMVTTMRRFKGMPKFSWLEQLEVRFDQNLLKGQKPVVAFDDSYNETAMAPFDPLLRAIDSKTVVDLVASHCIILRELSHKMRKALS